MQTVYTDAKQLQRHRTTTTSCKMTTKVLITTTEMQNDYTKHTKQVQKDAKRLQKHTKQVQKDAKQPYQNAKQLQRHKTTTKTTL